MSLAEYRKDPSAWVVAALVFALGGATGAGVREGFKPTDIERSVNDRADMIRRFERLEDKLDHALRAQELGR